MLQTPPQRTIRKQGDWLVCWVLGSAAVADCLAGTPETRWHLEGTSVNLRWKTVADCFLLLKHYSWCVRVCDGVVREGWPQIQRQAIEGGNKRPLALLQSRGWHMPPLLVLHDNHSKYHKFGDAEFAKRPSRVRSFVVPPKGMVQGRFSPSASRISIRYNVPERSAAVDVRWKSSAETYRLIQSLGEKTCDLQQDSLNEVWSAWSEFKLN